VFAVMWSGGAAGYIVVMSTRRNLMVPRQLGWRLFVTGCLAVGTFLAGASADLVSLSTWRANGGGGMSNQAGWEQQIAVANLTLASQEVGARPVCGRRPQDGYPAPHDGYPSPHVTPRPRDGIPSAHVIQYEYLLVSPGCGLKG
jgi:hypothetical protein